MGAKCILEGLLGGGGGCEEFGECCLESVERVLMRGFGGVVGHSWRKGLFWGRWVFLLIGDGEVVWLLALVWARKDG